MHLPTFEELETFEEKKERLIKDLKSNNNVYRL